MQLGARGRAMVIVIAAVAGCDPRVTPSSSVAEPAVARVRTARIPTIARPAPTIAVAMRPADPWGSDVQPTEPSEADADAAAEAAAREAEWSALREQRDVERDTNGDGVISDDERTASRRGRIGQLRGAADLDHDGRVTVTELATDPTSLARFGDPTTVDTNHDGDLSVEELDIAKTATRARRWW